MAALILRKGFLIFMQRKSISKKVRFDIFKRDLFTCQYCGGKSPQKVLEIDHIKPVSKGGTNEIDNLITSCFDCNRGKSAHEMSIIPDSLAEKIRIATEKEEQYHEFCKLMRKIELRKSREVDKIEAIYKDCYPDYKFTDKFKKSVNKFISELGYFDVEFAINKAIAVCGEDCLEYFCGICWNKIREKNVLDSHTPKD